MKSDQAHFHPGAEPGIDTSAASDTQPAHLVNLVADCDIHIVDFSDAGDPSHLRTINAGLLDELSKPRPDDMPVRWISVNGLSWDVIRAIGNKYNLHRLAIEDLIHTHTRTKVDWYADQAFIVLTLQKLVRLHQHRGDDQMCGCGDVEHPEHCDEKVRRISQDSGSSWWRRGKRKLQSKGSEILPRYLDQTDVNGKLDEFVSAHSGVSRETPVKPIRTLHRYESAQSPEHTAFMERHSVLSKEEMAVSVEQVSIFLLADNTVISFFEQSASEIENPIMDRLASEETMLRRSCDASLLLQAIIDAIVDLSVPVRDAFNLQRKVLQVDAMTNPDIRTSRALHIFGEEIDMLQNLFKPIVHLVNALRDHQVEPLVPTTAVQNARAETATSVIITPLAHTYFGDVLDHCITMIQSLEQMDASASNISTLIFNTVGAKTNNFMMILAVVTVFFAPLTFISGYFGMNFAAGSGLQHPFAFFWVVAIPALLGFMLVVFATMLWDNIRDFFAKRGIRAHRQLRRRRRGS
ncbi:hypothetical protein EJ03DRAFT_265675 [Teratosphaeria nubilosa]|uniref:Cora-domain-containing protein n=1 Tax=Teratosphaeria nubilosa TaxID=161662 RepID=A0A6G1LKJ2_9PEZI|nr:hypothetical protein EJ03DRAFT_265675 [Teratosphaeria nubilosa]